MTTATVATLAASPTPNWRLSAQPPPHGHRRYICPQSGIRFYPIPAGEDGRLLAVPGVTSILSVGMTSQERDRIDAWRQRELSAGRDPNAARNRGTRVHAALETYIRGGTPELEFWSDVDQMSGMTRHLDLYDEFLWNERPLRSGWEHCWSAPPGDPYRLARVWSLRWGYAGTPDLIGRLKGGLSVLGDFKTSTQPYFRCHGDKVPAHKQTGFLKYKKTVRQLCAYRIAAKETLDLDIDVLQIIVGLPGKEEAQMFFIQGPELELETQAFKRLAVKFWQQHAGSRLVPNQAA